MGENKKVDCVVVTTMPKEMNFEKGSTDTQSAVSPIFNKNNTNSIAIELDGHHFFADLNILIAQSPYVCNKTENYYLYSSLFTLIIDFCFLVSRSS